MSRHIAIAAAFSAAAALPAAAKDLAIDAGVGTTGLRANVQTKLVEGIVLRGGYNFLEFELDEEEYDDILYDAELDFSTFGAFVDLHPFANGFTVTGGVYHGDKDVLLAGTPSEPVEIGDQTFTPEQVGTLSGRATLEETAPYAGIGWDGALYADSRWTGYIRAGVMFTGSPDVSLEATGGLLVDQPEFQAELEKEEARLRDDVDDFEFYPVLSVGVSFRLF